MRQGFLRNTDSGIGNVKDGFPIHPKVRNGDCAARRSVFDGIIDEIDHNLTQTSGISDDMNRFTSLKP
jgi:hypothetical protein